MRGCFYTATYTDRRDYFDMTLQTVAQVLARAGGEPLAATIRIDGLPRSQERLASRALRRLGLAGGRVKGVRRDENDALIRLADAMCGLSRAAHEGQSEPKTIWRGAVTAGMIKEL